MLEGSHIQQLEESGDTQQFEKHEEFLSVVLEESPPWDDGQ